MLLRPETYVGSIEPETDVETWVLDEKTNSPTFGKMILRPQLSPDDPLKDPGFWILDSETCLVLQALVL